MPYTNQDFDQMKIPTKNNDELFEELVKFFSYAPNPHEQAIEEVAKVIVAHHDLQHFFVCKENDNRFILRWVDDFGHFDSTFTANEIVYLLFKEDMEEIEPNTWYNLNNDLSVLSNDYIVFDKKFCNGEASSLVNLLSGKYKKSYAYIPDNQDRVEIETIPFEEANPFFK